MTTTTRKIELELPVSFLDELKALKPRWMDVNEQELVACAIVNGDYSAYKQTLQNTNERVQKLTDSVKQGRKLDRPKSPLRGKIKNSGTTATTS